MEAAERERTAAGFQKPMPEVPHRQSTFMRGEESLSLAQRVVKMEGVLGKFLEAAPVEPVDEALSHLVSGILKMLQLLGVITEEASEKLGSWRDACLDLPRMLDHAWLRLRLPKKATVLKVLRQKADAEYVRELQTDLDALLACWHSLKFLPPDVIRACSLSQLSGEPPGNQRSLQAVRSEDMIHTPAAPGVAPGAGARRPHSAGHRLAGSATPSSIARHVVEDSCSSTPEMQKDAWLEAH